MPRRIVKVTITPGEDFASVQAPDMETICVPANAVLRARMQNRDVRFFDADVIPSAVDLLDVAPDQEW